MSPLKLLLDRSLPAKDFEKKYHAIVKYSNGIPVWLWTLGIVYLIEFIFIRYIFNVVSTNPAHALGTLEVLRPLKFLPNYVFTGWDAEHYHRLMLDYSHPVWPPVYPFLLKLFYGFLGDSDQAFIKSAQIISFGSHICIAIGLDKYARIYQMNNSRRMVFLLCLFFFPGHTVFMAAYSESLFLAIVVWAFLFHHNENYLYAAVLISLAIMIRYMGLFLAAAFLVYHAWQMWQSKRLAWRKMAIAALPVSIWILWQLFVWLYFGIHLFKSGHAAWQTELIENHVGSDQNPIIWVLQYLFWWGPSDVLISSYSALIAIPLLFSQKLRLEALFVALFLASFLVHLYRPFPFSRYISVIFPVLFIYTYHLTRVRILKVSLPAMCVIYSCAHQLLLFRGWIGEP